MNDWTVDHAPSAMRLKMTGNVPRCPDCRFFIPPHIAIKPFCEKYNTHPKDAPDVTDAEGGKWLTCPKFQSKQP